MALVVENGTGIIGAESYASVAETDAWYAGRPGADATSWAAASEPQKEGALREASLYLDVHFLSGRSPYVDGQGLGWPFDDWEYSLATLQTLKRATMMIAPLALSSALVSTLPAEAPVTSKTDKVGDLSESRTYAVSEWGAPTVVAGRDLSFLGRMLAFLGGSGIVVGQRALG